MSDLMRASRDAARAIARMNGSGRANGSDQRGMAWGTVVSVKGQFVDVMIGGTVSGSLRYTTACDGMAEGDRVMVQYVGHEPVVVGVVSSGEPKHFEIADAVQLSVSGKMCVISVDFLNITKANTMQTVGKLPSWCVPHPSGNGSDGRWIGYMFVRGAQSYGQIMVRTDGTIEAYSSTEGEYHSGQVFFLMK